jgi:hypothetical protein
VADKDFFLDYNAKAPAPLDPAIANAFLRLISNRFSDGFDVEVSAFFGEERVFLSGEDLGLSLNMSLNRAALQIHFKNCEASLLEDENNQKNAEWSIKQVRKVNSGKATMRNVNVSLDVSVATSLEQTIGSAGGAFKGDGGIGTTNNSETQAVAERTVGNWSMNSATGILVGTHTQPLSGTEVERFKGWRVKPKPNSDVLAVVAILSTRADWINFSNVDDDSFTGRIGRKAKKLFRSKRQEKKEYFNLLLKTLAEKGLSASENIGDAILAVAVQVLRVNSESDADYAPVAVVLENQSPSRKIDIDSQSIDHFLNLDDGEEVKFLKELGVSESSIISVTNKYTDNRKSKRGIFSAGSTPIRALEALRNLSEKGEPMRIEEWDSKQIGRVRTDLVNLGIVSVENGFVSPSYSYREDPELALRHAAAKTPMLVTARSILIENPNASAEEIMKGVSASHAKTYNSEASITRIGNALRRWTFWLEPHLIDPEGGSKSKMYRLGALSNQSRKGHETLATPDNLAIAQKALDNGLGRKGAAELLGVHENTIRLWITKGLLKEKK